MEEQNNKGKKVDGQLYDNQIDIRKYQDLSGLTLKKINFGLWFVRNKKNFYKIIISLLFVVSAVSWTYGIYGFAYYLVKGMSEDEMMLREMVNNSPDFYEITRKNAAVELKFSPVSFFPLGDNRYDFVFQVENPNDKFRANIDYCYSFSAEEVCFNDFVLPKEKKFIINISQKLKNNPSSVNLLVKNIGWLRANPHKYPNWQKYYNEHMNIDIENEVFEKTRQGLNAINFTAFNNTSYNYLKVDLNIVLYSGSAIVGVYKYNLENFLSDESRDVEIVWPEAISYVSRVGVYPSLDIMKDDIYLDYDAGPGNVK